MNFWKDAYKWGWADVDMLRQMVITDNFPWGDITEAEYEEITGVPFRVEGSNENPEEVEQ